MLHALVLRPPASGLSLGSFSGPTLGLLSEPPGISVLADVRALVLRHLQDKAATNCKILLCMSNSLLLL